MYIIIRLRLVTNPTVSATAAITSTAPMEIPTMAPVGRLADSSLSAETVERVLGGRSLLDLLVDATGKAVVDIAMMVVVRIIVDCSIMFTIAITMY